MSDIEALSRADQKLLLDIARRAIVQHLKRGLMPEVKVSSEGLLRKRGAFVSLHVDEELRGCIGSMHADHPLWRTVADMAVQAASADPRFRPLAQNELGYADIEISALSPLKRVHPEVVEVGRHGLFVSCAKRRGLLLPQVATQFSWSRESFLNETCRKAGLPLDAWQRDDAIVCVFEAEVFSDVSLEDD